MQADKATQLAREQAKKSFADLQSLRDLLGVGGARAAVHEIPRLTKDLPKHSGFVKQTKAPSERVDP